MILLKGLEDPEVTAVDKLNNDLMEQAGGKAKAQSSRRGFLKKALVAGVAVTATAALAKKTGQVLLKEDYQKAYLDDLLPGDSVLRGRQYVLMSKAEKEALVRQFMDFYSNPLV